MEWNVLIKHVVGGRNQPVSVISVLPRECDAVAAHCGYNLIILLVHNQPCVPFADKSAHL